MLKVATWNILLEDDEFNLNWGNPLSIALCSNRTACVEARWQRLWEQLEEDSVVDLFLLQEVEDGFLRLHPAQSNWKLLQRSGECAILGRNDMIVREIYELETIPGLSGCPAVPVAVVTMGEGEVHVGSLHLKASVDSREWFDFVLPDLFNGSMILGGDFNQNLTEFETVLGWSVLFAGLQENPLLGTSQKEFNWMGNLDGFLLHPGNDSAIAYTEPTILLEGFLPKVVEGLPQGGVVQEFAQFRWDDSTLLFSPTSLFQNDTVEVPMSHPMEEVLSDHFMVLANFGSSASTSAESAVPQSAGDEISVQGNNFIGIPAGDINDTQQSAGGEVKPVTTIFPGTPPGTSDAGHNPLTFPLLLVVLALFAAIMG